ncbi:hypothetical protein EC973_000749 [Apophysomyces ossiformis]|uniref:Alpha/beta hydrolase fold-3 domain-containing protein n=1 Tax=Apophysomyces ossiformis TaxID=679940 RepID=A0A8H7BN30_9FUNG|nr:hypothetical protein EC973_000749 [Apophysomyces ossiformis]
MFLSNTLSVAFKLGISGLLSVFLAFEIAKQFGEHIVVRCLRGLIQQLPLRIRCLVAKTGVSFPVAISRSIISLGMRPYGFQRDWISPPVEMNTWSGYWVFPNAKNHKRHMEHIEASKSDMVILYFHGGGFALGTPTLYMESMIYMIERLQEKHGICARIFTVDYRLSPEHIWPRAQEDCVKAYRYLLGLGVKPSKIIMAGDSAGGNLVSTATLLIRDQGLPLPRGHVLISPWVTLEPHSPSYITNEKSDCITREVVCERAPYAYLPQLLNLKGDERKKLLQNPRVSPLYANFEQFCPTLVTYGGAEMFQHDIEALIGRLKDYHVEVQVLTRPETPHIWVIEPLMSPTYAMWKQDFNCLTDWCASRIEI